VPEIVLSDWEEVLQFDPASIDESVHAQAVDDFKQWFADSILKLQRMAGH